VIAQIEKQARKTGPKYSTKTPLPPHRTLNNFLGDFPEKPKSQNPQSKTNPHLIHQAKHRVGKHAQPTRRSNGKMNEISDGYADQSNPEKNIDTLLFGMITTAGVLVF
jgi:hypothetical protein